MRLVSAEALPIVLPGWATKKSARTTKTSDSPSAPAVSE